MQAACDTCHRRKSRCNKVKPRCGFCAKSNSDCTYSHRSRDPSTRREHVEGIERRLRQEEAKNQALISEIARLKSLAASRDREDCDTSQDVIQPTTTHSFSSGDVINEVSFLASTAAGERHYLGSTSGVLFADLVRASVDIHPVLKDTSPGARVLGSIRSPSLRQNHANIQESLPPKDLAKELFSNYFAHDHICYPFLLPAATFPIIESIYTDPSFYGNNPFQAFVFDMILAISTVNVYKFDWQMLPSAETHHARAMNQATEVFQGGGLHSLQAILLLCQYRTSSSMQDTSASMWHLVGIAVRIAYELGLHRESAYDINTGPDTETDDLERVRNQEIRRRCFWSLLCMDRIVSITLGRPMALHMEAIDVELPVVGSDHVLTSEMTALDINRTLIFVHIVNYRLLCGKIMRSLHSPKKTEQNEVMIRYLRDELASELEDWHRKTGDLKLPDQDAPSDLPHRRSSFLCKEWYEVIYHNAMLMLFRPCPMLSDTGDSGTLQKLFNSSKEAVSLYASLHRSRKINYSWITLHSVFMSGLTYLYSLSRHFRERRRTSPAGAVLGTDPTAIEIVNETRACSNVLVAVSERWDLLRNCHEVFDRLSDAVLSDAIKLQCSMSSSRERTPVIAPHVSATALIPTNSDTSSTQDRLSDGGRPSYNTSWVGNDYTNSAPGFYSTASPLAIDSEFRNCFGDLRNLYSTPFAGDPVMELSQDWLGYIEGFDKMSHNAPQLYTGEI